MIKKFYVYALIDPRDGGVFYVGKGQGKRSQIHLQHSINGTHNNPYLRNKINKIHKQGLAYGVDFLFSSDNESECFEKEMFYISLFGRNTLCNLTDGGEGQSGRLCSLESRKKMSLAHMGKILSEEHKDNIRISNKGKHNHSAKEIEAIRSRMKGKTLFLGRTHSEETRRKMSENKKGKRLSLETIAKMSARMKGRPSPNKGKPGTNLGRHFSEAHKEKLREAMRRRVMDPEYRSRMKAAAVLREGKKRAAKLEAMAA